MTKSKVLSREEILFGKPSYELLLFIKSTWPELKLSQTLTILEKAQKVLESILEAEVNEKRYDVLHKIPIKATIIPKPFF